MASIILFIVVIALLGFLISLVVRIRPSGQGATAEQVEQGISTLNKNLERTERALREELARNREEASSVGKQSREESAAAMKAFTESILARLTEQAGMQKNLLDAFSKQLANLTESNEKRLETLRGTVEQQLRRMQEDNSAKLEQMRATVDEKLHATLEKRLGESFQLVSERLEQVHKGLGEMQSLASGVGDLKKVLTNVKTRGTWGEVQLGNLLEQMLSPEQYAANVATKNGSNDRVEFAIKLPGREKMNGDAVWLPIDAKFPLEDYQRLVEAQELSNAPLVEEARKMLETRIKGEAKTIKEKYLDPPSTTDFAIMFLPTEGLYAEVLRRPGLSDILQRDYRITVTGPTTLAAL
ncbi:MAG TPA: DNA recombination protein RmuC, partial [Bacteroidota bacterium]|nr:DNA recombination protein RmuC [Bacteroidota bacterium]